MLTNWFGICVLSINFNKTFQFSRQNPYDTNAHLRRSTIDNKYNFTSNDDLTTEAVASHDSGLFGTRDPNTRPGVPGNAPDLPPRIDRTSKPITPPSTLLTTAGTRNSMGLNANSGSNNGTYGRSAHERLFSGGNSSLTKTLADAAPTYEDEYSTRINPTADKRNSVNASSLDRKQTTPLMEKGARNASSSNTPSNGKTNGSSYDSVSSYDSCNAAMQSLRLGPNAPDDLKSVPSVA